MALTLQDILKTEIKQLTVDLDFKLASPRIHCMDGTSFSVQASKFTYCTPRSNYGPWHEVELGYPSKHFLALEQYKDANDETAQVDSVFGYVPVEIVEQIIKKCGGICEELTLLMKDYVSN